MKFLKIIGIIILSLFTILMGISAFSPERMELEESLVINAPTLSVFEEVHNFQNWAKWSPWEQKDPEMKKNISVPSYGEGSYMEWESKSQGNGKQIIVVSEVGKHIRTKLTFSDWEGDNYADFYFNENNGETTVTWTMEGAPVSFIWRWFNPFMKMMVSKDYQEGLNNLKKLAESKPKAAEIIVEPTQVSHVIALSYRDTATMSEIQSSLGAAFGKIMTYIQESGLKQTGPVFSFYHYHANDTIVFEAGIPVDKSVEAKNRVTPIEIKEGKALVAHYFGNYDGLAKAHAAVDRWVEKNQAQVIGPPWEVYVTDPMMEKDPSKWLTDVYYPIK